MSSGFPGGVRIDQLERYQNAEVASLTLERWVLEVSSTALSALQALAGALLIFFAVALIAFVIVRVVELLE